MNPPKETVEELYARSIEISNKITQARMEMGLDGPDNDPAQLAAIAALQAELDEMAKKLNAAS